MFGNDSSAYRFDGSNDYVLIDEMGDNYPEEEASVAF